ncbi:unnamed protein product [Acanthoscelides obtectus]|nr:unnamed protein product [Acanthoscelides obtectus]CAK1657081.1 Protein pangolin, isoforms A/H/I/S [Acanthoscelides obtectus]
MKFSERINNYNNNAIFSCCKEKCSLSPPGTKGCLFDSETLTLEEFAIWKELKELMCLTRPPMYPFSAGQYPYPMLSPEMSQVASWHTPSVYPLGPGAAGSFRAAAAAAAAAAASYPAGSLPGLSSAAADFYRFSPTAAGLIQPHPGLSPHPPPPHHPHSHAHHHIGGGPGGGHPAIVTPGPKQELHPDLNHR